MDPVLLKHEQRELMAQPGGVTMGRQYSASSTWPDLGQAVSNSVTTVSWQWHSGHRHRIKIGNFDHVHLFGSMAVSVVCSSSSCGWNKDAQTLI
jgi:hypothetical protein